jgi:hypothetical protein
MVEIVSDLTGGQDRVRRVVEEPNGHGAEHLTGGVPGPADHDDRFAAAGRSRISQRYLVRLSRLLPRRP